MRTQSHVQALEADIAQAHGELCKGLEAAGLKQERRGLRLPVVGLAWEWLGDDVLSLSFQLPAGSYATTVLRELGDVEDVQRQ